MIGQIKEVEKKMIRGQRIGKDQERGLPIWDFDKKKLDLGVLNWH